MVGQHAARRRWRLAPGAAAVLIAGAVVAITVAPRVDPQAALVTSGGKVTPVKSGHPAVHHSSGADPTRLAPGAPPSAMAPWSLAFDDEFNGTSLDSSKWSTCYDWDCTNRGNPELEWYQASNVSEGNGSLSLTATATPVNGMPYASGLIQSNNRFDFTYGYAVIRVRFPRGIGLWPAFWLIPQDHTWPPEIDAVEARGNEPDLVAQNLFAPDGSQSPSYVRLSDTTAGYHTFGVDWEPGSVSWYIDGVLQRQAKVSISKPMYLVANLAVAADPPPDASTAFPATMSIDYIRVYQHPPATSGGTAPGG